MLFHFDKKINIDKFKYIKLILRHIIYYTAQRMLIHVELIEYYDFLIRVIYIEMTAYNIENVIFYLLLNLFVNKLFINLNINNLSKFQEQF